MALSICRTRTLIEAAVRNKHLVRVWYTDGAQGWVYYYPDGSHAWHISSDLFSTIKHYKGLEEILDGICQVVVTYEGGKKNVVDVRHVPPDVR